MDVACGIVIAAYLQNYMLIDEIMHYERKSIVKPIVKCIRKCRKKKKQKSTRRWNLFADYFYSLLKYIE